MKRGIFFWMFVLTIGASNFSEANEMIVGISFSTNLFEVSFSETSFSDVRPWSRLNIYETGEGPKHKFRAQENHHLYMGMVILGSGYVLDKKSLKIIGQLMIFDDLVQHIFQVQTPLHLLSDKAWRWRWYRDAAGFTDNLYR